MNVEELHTYCLSKKGAEESFPFGEETIVFKVKGKMFLLADLISEPIEFNVKCDPEKAIELRERYSCVLPGYHMNKKHWNTIICNGCVSDKQIREWIDESYSLVVKGLTAKLKAELEKQ